MLETMNSFASSDNVPVVDSESHLVSTCKTSLFSASLDVQIHTECYAVQFCSPTK